jgi:UDPglucose--hexose-1-phosphate uridylyltransferase
MSSPFNEMRKDYLLDRWSVFATQRKRRPTDFIKLSDKKEFGVCALEPGNEHMTPPAVLVYIPVNGGIEKAKDQNGTRHKNWLVRVVPNLYPAFTPPAESEAYKIDEGDFVGARATGYHEVLVESPVHNEHPSRARVSQLALVVNAYVDRLRELSSRPYVKYVSIFRNHGPEAGASLSHAHTQLIATPVVPQIIDEESKASERRFRDEGECAFCKILQKETEGPRFIWKNNDFVAFAPWASVHPFEFWIFPRRHQTSMLELSQQEINSLARAMRICFGGLGSLLKNPPYNFGFHQLTDGNHRHYHWHLEVYPRLTIWAGFEKSTGMFINVISPEAAALDLRKAAEEEERKV